MADERSPDTGARVLLITASLVLVVAGLRAIKAIALPLLLAVFLSILSAPLLNWLCRHRIPKVVAVVTTVLANVSVMAIFLLLIGGSVNSFVQSIPQYQTRVEKFADDTLDWLDQRGVIDWLERQGIDTSEYSWLRQEPLLPEDLMSGFPVTEESGGTAPAPLHSVRPPIPGSPEPPAGGETGGEGGLFDLGFILELFVDLSVATLRSVASVLAMTLFVFLFMIFILFEASGLPRKLEVVFGWPHDTMDRFTVEIQRYLAIKTGVSLATGLLVGFGLWVIGVDFPLLWGLIAFVFNYIPNVGSILAAVPPFFVALIDHGFGRALLVALIFFAVNVALGNFLEPHLMGRQFGISTLVVVLSLFFWGWLWGAVGMLLSVPLTMIVKILLENTEDFRWVARLIGANPRS